MIKKKPDLTPELATRTRMRWIEPLTTAKARARFWNPLRVMVPVMLCCALGCALLFSLLGSVAIRVRTGSWLGIPALFFALVGGVFGLLAAFSLRVRVDRQEVELRADDFFVYSRQPRSMPYDELRGYSIVEPTIRATRYRLLMLYPRTRRAFSIGIAPEITDDQIHAVLGGRVPFVTIIDEQALNAD